MPNVITLSIDVTLIEKARLVEGKKLNKKNVLPKYLSLALIPSKPTQFGDRRDENTHIVFQSTSKEERESGVRGDILGNAKEMGGRSQQSAQQSSQQPVNQSGQDEIQMEDSGVPF